MAKYLTLTLRENRSASLFPAIVLAVIVGVESGLQCQGRNVAPNGTLLGDYTACEQNVQFSVCVSF